MKQETSDHNTSDSACAVDRPDELNCFNAVLDAMSAGLFVCRGRKRSCTIVHISEAFTKITGYTEAAILGQKLDFLYGSRTDPPTVRSINQALARGRKFQGEILCYQSEGKGVWYTLIIAPMSSTEKEFFAGALIDITSRGFQGDQLRARERTYRGIFENAVEGIYQSTPDGNYLNVNRALARMYGYESPKDLLGQIRDIQQQIYVDPSMRERFMAEMDRSDVVHGWEYQVRRRDGKIIWISESARAVRDEHGRAQYYEGFIEEITLRKQAEAALRTSQQQLIETSRQVGMAEVATGVLHNMGNALNSINVSVALISEKVRSSKIKGVKKAASLMEAHASDIGDFIASDCKGRKLPEYLGQLGDYLCLEQNELLEELKRLRNSLEHVNAILGMQQDYAKRACVAEKISPAELLEDALRMSACSLARHEIAVIREYSPDLPEVTVSKHAVLQILINLIRNAQKACEAPGNDARCLTLRIGTTNSGRFIRMEVADNGVGIPQANLTRIFGHGFTTRKDGHGFGLHSGALMARELGGSLTAHSDGPGKGACFALEFPLQPAIGNCEPPG